MSLHTPQISDDGIIAGQAETARYSLDHLVGGVGSIGLTVSLDETEILPACAAADIFLMALNARRRAASSFQDPPSEIRHGASHAQSTGYPLALRIHCTAAAHTAIPPSVRRASPSRYRLLPRAGPPLRRPNLG